MRTRSTGKEEGTVTVQPGREPRSGSDLQPRVAATANMEFRYEETSNPNGVVFLSKDQIECDEPMFGIGTTALRLN